MYYNYASYVNKVGVLYYFDGCIYWYKSGSLGKWFVDTIEKISHVNLLIFSYWFISIRIPQMKYDYISGDQSKYDTSIVARYIDTDTVKKSIICIRTIYHMMLYSPRMMHIPVMIKLRS